MAEESQNDTSVDLEKQIIDSFISDYVSDQLDLEYLYNKYNESTVNIWLARSDIVKRIIDSKRIQSEKCDLLNKQLNTFKQKASEIIKKVLDGEVVNKDQIRMAEKVFSAEFSFAESRGKALGEKSAQVGDSRKEIAIMIDSDDENL
jgi:hypothetical protein